LAVLIFLAAVAFDTSNIELWKGGDDGLTNRFYDALEKAVAPLKVSSTASLKITVEQVKPKTWKHLGHPYDSADVTIRFERANGPPNTFRCTFVDYDFQPCVTRAATLTKSLAGLSE